MNHSATADGIGLRIGTTGITSIQSEFPLDLPVFTNHSHGGCEIEQKYLFARGGDSKEDHAQKETFLKGHFSDHPSRIVDFDGIDYCRMVIGADGNEYYYRYRTGKPINRRMCVKVKVPGLQGVREEIEFDLVNNNGTSEKEGDDEALKSRALTFLSIICRAGKHASHRDIHVKGRIRFFPIKDYPGRELEVVIYTGENLLTRDKVSVGEIEVHGFSRNEIEAARKHISEWEERLGWGTYYTPLSMTELLA